MAGRFIGNTWFAAALLLAAGCCKLPETAIRQDASLSPSSRGHNIDEGMANHGRGFGQDAVTLPLTAERLADLLSSTDDQDTIAGTRFDDYSVVLKGDGEQLMIFIEDGGTSLQAVLPYFGSLQGDHRKIGDWNAGRRFGRAYLDAEGGPILASDLLLVQGMTAEALRTWGRLLVRMAPVFRDGVWPKAAPPESQPGR